MSTAVMWLLLFVVVALGILIAALSKTKFTTQKIATIGIMAALFCSFGFLAFGSRLGRSAFLQQIGEYTDPVSGLLLILLGLCQLYH